MSSRWAHGRLEDLFARFEEGTTPAGTEPVGAAPTDTEPTGTEPVETMPAGTDHRVPRLATLRRQQRRASPNTPASDHRSVDRRSWGTSTGRSPGWLRNGPFRCNRGPPRIHAPNAAEDTLPAAPDHWHIRDCQFDGGRSLHQTRGGSRHRIARPAAGVAVIGIGSSIAIVVGTHWDGIRRRVEALSSWVRDQHCRPALIDQSYRETTRTLRVSIRTRARPTTRYRGRSPPTRSPRGSRLAQPP